MDIEMDMEMELGVEGDVCRVGTTFVWAPILLVGTSIHTVVTQYRPYLVSGLLEHSFYSTSCSKLVMKF